MNRYALQKQTGYISHSLDIETAIAEIRNGRRKTHITPTIDTVRKLKPRITEMKEVCPKKAELKPHTSPQTHEQASTLRDPRIESPRKKRHRYRVIIRKPPLKKENGCCMK